MVWQNFMWVPWLELPVVAVQLTQLQIVRPWQKPRRWWSKSFSWTQWYYTEKVLINAAQGKCIILIVSFHFSKAVLWSISISVERKNCLFNSLETTGEFLIRNFHSRYSASHFDFPNTSAYLYQIEELTRNHTLSQRATVQSCAYDFPMWHYENRTYYCFNWISNNTVYHRSNLPECILAFWNTNSESCDNDSVLWW